MKKINLTIATPTKKKKQYKKTWDSGHLLKQTFQNILKEGEMQD